MAYTGVVYEFETGGELVKVVLGHVVADATFGL